MSSHIILFSDFELLLHHQRIEQRVCRFSLKSILIFIDDVHFSMKYASRVYHICTIRRSWKSHEGIDRPVVHRQQWVTATFPMGTILEVFDSNGKYPSHIQLLVDEVMSCRISSRIVFFFFWLNECFSQHHHALQGIEPSCDFLSQLLLMYGSVAGIFWNSSIPMIQEH